MFNPALERTRFARRSLRLLCFSELKDDANAHSVGDCTGLSPKWTLPELLGY